MKSDIAILGGAAVATIMVAVLIANGASGVAVIFFVILGGLLVSSIGRAMRTPIDAAWLPKWVMIGFLAKLAGTFARYYMVAVFYGYGDSYRYYRIGLDIAEQWRDGRLPSLSGRGSLGTQVTEMVTGTLFAVITPDILGGFVAFAILAYLGQLLLYSAFRRHAAPNQLKPYLILIVLFPTYAFWPSSVGKDALVLLGIGAAAYFVSRSLEAFEFRWLLGLGLALGAVGLIRIHIAGLLVAAMVVTTLVAKRPPIDAPGVPMRRLLILLGGLTAAAVVIAVAPDIFGVDLLSSQDRDGFTAEVAERTSEGTVAEGGPVTSPLDVPGAFVHVLFRPLAFEASELQHYFAAAETTAILLLSIWKLPAVLRNLGRWRANPYLVFSTLYTIGFAIAFSAIRNLGIIARQRGQVLAFFFCFIVALGWEPEEPEEPELTEYLDQPTTPGYLQPQRPTHQLTR